MCIYISQYTQIYLVDQFKTHYLCAVFFMVLDFKVNN